MQISSGGYNLEVACTDPAVLVWIGELLQSERPVCDITSRSHLACRFQITGHQPLEIGWWLVGQLCHLGWEPFGNIRWEPSWGLGFISLRYASEGASMRILSGDSSSG